MSRDLEKIKLDIIHLKEAFENISSTVGDIQKMIDKFDDNIQQSSPTSMFSDQVRDQIQQFITANPISTASVASLNPSNLDLDFLTTAPQQFVRKSSRQGQCKFCPNFYEFSANFACQSRSPQRS